MRCRVESRREPSHSSRRAGTYVTRPHNRVARVRTLMTLRKFNGADRFRRQCRWSSVRPELLRLEKRGNQTTANKQFALAA